MLTPHASLAPLLGAFNFQNSQGLKDSARLSLSQNKDFKPSDIAKFLEGLSKDEIKLIKENLDNAVKQVARVNPSLMQFAKKHLDQIIVLPREEFQKLYKEILENNGQTISNDQLKRVVGASLTMQDANSNDLTTVTLLVAEEMRNPFSAMKVLTHELHHVKQNTESILKTGKPPGTSNDRERYAYSRTISDLEKLKNIWIKEKKDANKIKLLQKEIDDQKLNLKIYS